MATLAGRVGDVEHHAPRRRAGRHGHHRPQSFAAQSGATAERSDPGDEHPRQSRRRSSGDVTAGGGADRGADQPPRPPAPATGSARRAAAGSRRPVGDADLAYRGASRPALRNAAGGLGRPQRQRHGEPEPAARPLAVVGARSDAGTGRLVLERAGGDSGRSHRAGALRRDAAADASVVPAWGWPEPEPRHRRSAGRGLAGAVGAPENAG